MSDDKDPPVDELAKASVEQQKPTIEDADDDDVSAAAAATQQQNDAGSSSGAAGGPIVSLQDLLAEQEELEKDYAAVLGGSDEKCCTYSKGYIKRQALYACLTCTPEARTDAKKRAGVCLACSYKCHENHEMIELYTKRLFRCDCGTSKILAVRCRLDEQKLDANDANAYNQNFSGVYCVCQRPYPDPEDPIDDEMIQCIVCEDWYHCRHLGGAGVPNTQDFTEMICGQCMARLPFLQNYVADFAVKCDSTAGNKSGDISVADTTIDESVADVSVAKVDAEASASVDEKMVVDDEQEEATAEKKPDDEHATAAAAAPPAVVDEQLKDEINQCIMDIIEINKSNGEANDDDKKAGTNVDNDVDAAAASSPAAKRRKVDNETTDNVPAAAGSSKVCKRPAAPPNGPVAGATFWPHDWRLNLCTCDECIQLLRLKRVEYLLDQEDTVLSYQEKGLAKVGAADSSYYDRGMEALSSMGHVQQVNAIMGYNKLKEKLGEFLSAFVASKQVVTEEDINRFFRMMNKEREEDGFGGADGAV